MGVQEISKKWKKWNQMFVILIFAVLKFWNIENPKFRNCKNCDFDSYQSQQSHRGSGTPKFVNTFLFPLPKSHWRLKLDSYDSDIRLILQSTQREFLREILYNNIAIIAIQHSKVHFLDTFGYFSHTGEWNSLKSVWQISPYILA